MIYGIENIKKHIEERYGVCTKAEHVAMIHAELGNWLEAMHNFGMISDEDYNKAGAAMWAYEESTYARFTQF